MKPRQIIDLLSIVLPLLIILLGILRLFVKKNGWVNGLVMVCAVLLLLGGLIRYFILGSGGGGANRDNGPKPLPIAVSKHSDPFNRSFESVLTAYYALSDAFAKGDSVVINRQATTLSGALDSFAINELQVDTIIYQTALQPYENAKAETAGITGDPSMEEKRGSFNILSNEIFSLISTARYDLGKVYWLECDKAFGDDKPGNWISKTEQGQNPYGQKDCAELKTTIDFVPAPAPTPPADTTKKK